MFIRLFILIFILNGSLQAADDIKKPFFDFFRKLIEPPKPPPKPVAEVIAQPKVQKPVIPPLVMQINGISGDEGSRVAIVTYKGEQKLISSGDTTADFNVISIDADKITVLHKAAQRRQEINF